MKALEPAPILGEEAYARMLRAIRDGIFPPGTRVREIQVAKWLKMSRTPVRQAVQRLEAEGLLTMAPRAGLTVTEVDSNLVRELYAMREVLEGTAARLAAEWASPAEVQALQELIVEEGAAQRPNLSVDRNRHFHGLVYRSAKNRFLLKSLSALHDSLVLLGRSTLENKVRVRNAAAEHAQVVEAIAARDAERAEKVMRRHIRNSYEERLKLLFPKAAVRR